MDTGTLIDRLDEELRTTDYADVDASANGLQVGSREDYANRVAFAVDAATETIEAAVDWGADLLVVHHGLSWGGIDRVTGRTYDRIAALAEHDIDLYVSHLPLDGHREFGNAAGIARLIGLANRRPFGSLGPVHVGQRGVLEDTVRTDELEATLDSELDHDGEGIRVLADDGREVADVAIVTGSGTDWYDDAVAAGVDAYITGEPKGKLYHMARESGVPVFLGGHYATETFGIESLAEAVDQWGPETTVIDAPTGL